jgi:hypothetical protein
MKIPIQMPCIPSHPISQKRGNSDKSKRSSLPACFQETSPAIASK